MSRRDLGTPRTGRLSIGAPRDPDAFGRLAETVARFLGTGRYLVVQTVLVVIWITLNVLLVVFGTEPFDPYPFILLNLAFSTQAAYAAPLILLAQNRQDDRDRAQSEVDRTMQARVRSDTEYLAREVASINSSLGEVTTVEDLAKAVERISTAMESLGRRIDDLAVTVAPSAGEPDGADDAVVPDDDEFSAGTA